MVPGPGACRKGIRGEPAEEVEAVVSLRRASRAVCYRCCGFYVSLRK
jgi:hypothetical protein